MYVCIYVFLWTEAQKKKSNQKSNRLNEIEFFFSRMQTLFYMSILGLKFNQVHII
jgi:hypothetical protein